MLTLKNVGGVESYDEENEIFLINGGITIELEHSLVSVSKWESIYEKSFLSEKNKSHEEVLHYVELMILTPNLPKDVVKTFSEEDFKQINAYIESKQTATWFSDSRRTAPSREKVTAELIYFWMIAHEIPFECQYWHLNKLLTLIRVCNIKKNTQKKLSPKEAAARNRELNRQRRQEYGTRG